MKRLMSLILVFSLMFSLLTLPVSALETGTEDNFSTQMAQAYLNVINEIIDGYGVAINDNYNTGLYYGKLIDFQGDGQKELYLLYATDESTFKDSIWGFDGTKPYLIGENTYQPGGSRTYGKLGLKQVGNKTYLCYEEIDAYEDTINDEYVNIEGKGLEVQELKGKELQLTTYVYSLLHYDENFEELSYEEYTKGTNYESREPISVKQYGEVFNKYSLSDDEILFTSVAGMFDYRVDKYSSADFINGLKDKLMSSNMKDIYSEKSKEEKKDIINFLNTFKYIYSDEIDISNPDQTELASSLNELLLYNPSLIEHEVVEILYDEEYDSWENQYKFKESVVKNKIIELFGVNLDFKKYSPDIYDDGYLYINQPWDAPMWPINRVTKMYSLENNLYYLIIETFILEDYDNNEGISDRLFEEIQNKSDNFYDLRQGHAVIKEVIKDGQKSYQLIKYNTNGEYLTDDQLNKYITKVNPEPNLSFDYSKVKDFVESSDYLNLFKEVITGLNKEKPNDRANNELVTYIQHAIENSSATSIKSNKNKVIINKDNIKQALNNAQSTKSEFDKIIKNNDIILNKNIEIVLRINIENLNLNKAMSVIFDKSAVESLGTANGVRILLGDNQHTVYISSEDMKNLAREIGNITIQIQKSKDKGIYTIVFVDSSGAEISRLSYPIGFSFPTDSEFATVFANYKGGSDNWGGQYSSTTGSIEFSTKYSGEYSILENEINISDIGDLPEEQQRAIRFMVSKGYFELDGDRFNGQASLNRYNFTTALVKMFFALDRDLETRFTDVEKSSKYYPYIASGQKDDIVKGFDDNTFRGEINISKEQVIALCGRTLADKKGYVYPENPSDYLGFVDGDTISRWAINDISIAVQNGLIYNGGILMPQMEISQSEGAEMLYKLFMLLYDTPPVAIEMEEIEEPNNSTGMIVGSILVVLILGGGSYIFIKNKKESNNN